MKSSMSASSRPTDPRNSSVTGRTWCRAMSGTPRDSRTSSPLCVTCQPMTSRLPGQVCSPQALIAGPVPSVVSTAPAAPSPKRAVATTFAVVRSLPQNVSVQSSTTRYRMRLPGWALAQAAARASPSAPPAQPRPNSGRRCTLRRNGSSSISRASSAGKAMPVDETVTSMSTSLHSRPAAARLSTVTCLSSPTALSMYRSFFCSKLWARSYQWTGAAAYLVSIAALQNTAFRRSRCAGGMSKRRWKKLIASSCGTRWGGTAVVSDTIRGRDRPDSVVIRCTPATTGAPWRVAGGRRHDRARTAAGSVRSA